MSYQNPKIPEGINVTDEHPLKDFFIMLAGIGLGIMAVISLLIFLAEYLVGFIPFEVEQQLANRFQTELVADSPAPTQHQQSIQQYLQSLANELAVAQQLPSSMKIIVHYMDSDEVNAFATLGGHIFVFKGLLNKMQSENALSMVLAHEIAHIKHRDPIIAMGRGITVGIAVLSLAGIEDNAIAQQVIGQLSVLTTLKFNRSMEQEADAEALITLHKHYGHTGGAETIFSLFLQEHGELKSPELFNTHPLSEDRINAVKSFQRKKEYLNRSTPNPLKNLPEWLAKPNNI